MNNNDLPLVTVITPAYNQGIFLRDTIESVLSQDYPHIELFVLNDGSTDETETILKEYNGRIRWETQKNMGQTATINKGWKLTRGSIITWLNSDDTFLPGGVRTGVEYLLAHPGVGIVFGDTLLTEADGTPIGKSPPQPPFDYMRFVVNCNNTVSQPSTFIRREILDKVGELDPSFYYFMDWDFWMRAGLYYKIEHITDILSTYRLHAESKTVSQSLKAAPELKYMYDKYFSRTDLPAAVVRSRKKAIMNMCFMSGGYYLKGGDKRSAARMARTAFSKNPAGIFSFRNWRCFLYCSFSGSKPYQWLRKLLGKK